MGVLAVGPETFAVVCRHYDDGIVINFLRAQSGYQPAHRRVCREERTIIRTPVIRSMRIEEVHPEKEWAARIRGEPA